jgi:predicted RNA-binding Zn ribbon-like protein
MTFAHDTTAALVLAADLVNSQPGRTGKADGLPGPAALEKFLDVHQMVPRSPGSPADLDAVRVLRSRLLAAWETTGQPASLAAIANDLLDQSGARPWLTDHNGTWHLHVTKADAQLAHRIAAQAGFAFADLVRLGETERLRQCLAPDCSAVLIDLSRNRSRRYCDTGNCGNRQHVAAYRARRTREADTADAPQLNRTRAQRRTATDGPCRRNHPGYDSVTLGCGAGASLETLRGMACRSSTIRTRRTRRSMVE